MNKKPIKVAVTGAAGQIGYALIFRIASGQAFGPEYKVDLNLLELEAALPSLNGVAMELDDCAFPLLNKVNCTSDLKEGMRDVDWVISVGAVPRKAGMERSDLLKINGGIFAPQGKAVNDYAAENVKMFVVGNPCNTNCLIAMNHAPRVPRENFYAMTMLDENRAKGQLAIKAGCSVADVTNMVIWGNHSTTQYPDFYHAKIAGKPVTEVIKDHSWLENDFIPLIQKRGAEVIKARGASSAASAANGVIDSIYSLTHDTNPGDFFSVALRSRGEYGIDEGLIFSFPCRVDHGKLSVVTDLKLNAFGEEKLRLTLDELRGERDAVRELGLIE